MTDESDISLRLSVLEATFEERTKAQDSAISTAFAANEKRLDILNESRGTVADLSALMMTRTEANTAHRALGDKIETDLNTLRVRMDAYGRPNYVLAVTAITAIVGLISGFWIVIGLKIDNTINPVSVMVEQLKYGQTTQDQKIANDVSELHQNRTDITALQGSLAQSVTDRAQLNAKLHGLETDLSNGRNERLKTFSSVESSLARLSVWMDFIQAKVFPGKSSPPMKEP